MEDHIKKLYQSWLSSSIVAKKCQVNLSLYVYVFVKCAHRHKNTIFQ